jgi:hypothetical protein
MYKLSNLWHPAKFNAPAPPQEEDPNVTIDRIIEDRLFGEEGRV